MSVVYFSFGSNLGDREGNVRRAVGLVGERVGRVLACSGMFVTEPWGFCSEHRFVNAAARVGTSLPPRRVLEVTQAVEREMGRTEKSRGGVYRDRVIDIDVLLYDDLVIDEEGLRVPHPLMFEREFVMRPLLEVLDGRGRELVARLQGERGGAGCKRCLV